MRISSRTPAGSAIKVAQGCIGDCASNVRPAREGQSANQIRPSQDAARKPIGSDRSMVIQAAGSRNCFQPADCGQKLSDTGIGPTWSLIIAVSCLPTSADA